jgi:hypothetical protein
MGSRYLFIVLYVFFEHHLSRGDYRRPELSGTGRRGWRTGFPAARVHEHPSVRAAKEANQ